MGWLLNAWHESAAKRELSALADRLSRVGLAVGGLAPGLLASVDQHAAAVRDILTLSGGRVGAVELAGYARGIQDAATESGWHPPLRDGWDADWVTLRLVAVCLLAAAGTVAVAGGDVDPLLFF
ncbi:DUF6401 family natural product biosynthesis protein [Prauserella flavalba]|uniref:Uncharacterized protein n=1 Tax=Prauserella flavalba TaxID=1477506 RepID=A0A318M6H3_9PSEU|nr:DUF6401 family natural product biosynthesis protein [Prauserella flavalba]PXY29696.1 hypothetical protein BA062_21195 [Prauserella flavalba]